MAEYDFEVDIKALIKAAQTMSEVIQEKKDTDVEDAVPTRDSLANQTVWDAVNEFQDRWERGINDMTEDITEVAGRIGQVAMTYAKFEEESAKLFDSAKSEISAIPPKPLLGAVS